MKTVNEIQINGEPKQVTARVWELGAEIEHWPEFLPHYRYMNVLERDETHKIADFGAKREFTLFKTPFLRAKPLEKADGFRAVSMTVGFAVPVKWQARQDLFPESLRITYKHLHGITRGMWVEWRLTPNENGVHIVIDHELKFPVPVIGNWIADRIIGNQFIRNIAGRTLWHLKMKIENESAPP